jgi:hypothetical protein
MSFLLFLETSGNQAYLYATNRLKENIGASELTCRTGTRWLLEAVAKAGGPTGIWLDNDLDPAGLRQRLRQGHTGNGIEIILATSGKGLIRVEKREAAEQIMRQVAARALSEAPGLDVCGAIVELNHPADPSNIADGNRLFAEAYTAVHHRYNDARNIMRSPLQRHPMLPGLETCTSSGLPAKRLEKIGEAEQALADASLKKREAAPAWFKRIGALMAGKGSVLLGKSMDELEKGFEALDWMGVVFADGNGLGQLFMNFEKYLPDGKAYSETLREFSLAIDECNETAFHTACAELASHAGDARGIIPVVPLVLGGDDLTLVMDGRYALDFTCTFLRTFDKQSGENTIIREIAGKGLKAPRLSACGGVAIVKRHFPFHAAHALAEALLKSAKQVKQHVLNAEGDPFPCSALDFHILYDATFSNLKTLRDERRTLHENGHTSRLYGGPYVVTSADKLQEAADHGKWASEHLISALTDRVHALSERDSDNRYILPNSQMHGLREALSLGRSVANNRLADLRRHYGNKLDALCENENRNSLFRSVGEEHSTRFLDAISSCGFWNNPADGEAKS